MSDNELFEVSDEWSSNSLIDSHKYNDWYQNSFDNNEEFWSEHGKRIDWIKPYSKVKNVNYHKNDFCIKWYEDGSLNASSNCIDRHLRERADQVAIIWEGDDPNLSLIHI